jgi:hypothetical protein
MRDLLEDESLLRLFLLGVIVTEFTDVGYNHWLVYQETFQH